MFENEFYKNLKKPDFTPPSRVFKIVWPILYILMAASLYLILTSEETVKIWAILIFLFQLFLNIIWSPVFFLLKKIKKALLISIILTISVLFMIFVFYEISPLSAFLQIPYFLWLCFATVLNMKFVKLN